MGFRYPSKERSENDEFVQRVRKILVITPFSDVRQFGKRRILTLKYNVEQNMSEQNVEKRYNLWTVESACRIEGVHNFWISFLTT